MHSIPAQLSNHIKRTVAGPMWHGAALDELLAHVSCEQAAARPIPGAHTIWEIVLHVTAWAEIALARVHGQRTSDPAPDEDWPPVPGSDLLSRSDPDWPQAVEGLKESHRRLAADVQLLDDAALDARVKGLDYPVGILLDGVVEHGTYHGGQIALLRKAVNG